jgi:predicted DCC family thiol-disulfide oxidoreductase YuxK
MATLPTYTLLYDGACRICTAQAHGLLRYDSDHRIALLALGSPAARALYPQITIEDAQRWMHIVAPDGRIWRGTDAVRLALLLLPLGRALGALLYLPGAMRLARPLYDWFARNRYRFGGYTAASCDGDACAVHLGLDARNNGQEPGALWANREPKIEDGGSRMEGQSSILYPRSSIICNLQL